MNSVKTLPALLILLLSSEWINSVDSLVVLLKNLVLTKALIVDNGTEFEMGDEVKILNDRLSIMATISEENRDMLRLPSSTAPKPYPKYGKERIMCRSGTGNMESKEEGQRMKKKISHAIESTLKFYSSHLDTLNMSEYTAALTILKAVDDKHGSPFQSLYPLAEWNSRICANAYEYHGTTTCLAFSQAFAGRNQQWQQYLDTDILADMQKDPNLGKDKETIWAVLNYDCIVALTVRCEIPHVCERVMFDPVPGSQYMLSHQLLHRVFAQSKMETCGFPARLVDESVNQQLCGKMLQEAELISDYGVPFILRDIFSEYVAFCGYIGYPNFFRDDWLDLMLKWQSKSEFGCFLKETGSHFVNNDLDIPRKITQKEREIGVESSNEVCHPHFTSVALSALAVAWDYLEENC